MRNMTEAERTRLRESLVGNLLLLLFGCGVLTFLVAVDRLDWFSIRPATGTSIAMARSTEKPAHSFQDRSTKLAQQPQPESALPR
ncbi:hypothetical protein GR702_18145 [Novosphingobium sp. FGD1]|jgi:hypothetical protein|uniref:Uncharacterized protein n=1 Tax=Novosphingobium silvae TaxID=2692619 RepID=A0A7X4K8V9_9SPHN|nr:hypothetical protein [Novosphingobium silvae]MYL99684.1 hypothetical protein [Novosphingobium silvae]